MGTGLPQLCRWHCRSQIDHAAVCSLTNVAAQRDHINNHVLTARAELHEAAEPLQQQGRSRHSSRSQLRGVGMPLGRTAAQCNSDAAAFP